MTDENHTNDRDEVLYAFHQACARPTADQIIEWTERYPHLAEDIRAHAVIAREWEAGSLAEEADETLLARAYSRALNAIYDAERAATPVPSAARCFTDVLAAREITVPQLADVIGIKRSIVADLVSGRMAGPIKGVFVNAVGNALRIGRDLFDAAHRRALASPSLGYAKADRTPSIIVRPYEEIIRTSEELTEAEKQHWLEED